MKIATLIVAAMLFVGCNGENSYDGANGLLSTKAPLNAELSSLYKLYKSDANASVSALEELQSSLEIFEISANEASLSALQEGFKEAVLAHKRVEALFVADEFSDDFLDTLGYMEYFHVGKNSDMIGELDAIFAASTPLSSALYKNANKSITSLEYTLFGEDENTSTLLLKMDARRIEAAGIMLARVISHAKSIRDFYNNDASFEASVKVSSAAMINQLIDSAYKLKEWRVGEAAGLVVKYAGATDAKLLEYYKSQNSLEAIKTIAQAHQSLMQTGLSAIATSANAASEAEAIENSLASIITLCESFEAPLEQSLGDAKTTQLYNAINVLQQNYIALINSMKFTQKIIEADGD
ncbi:MAG: hypothetical protein IE916_01630 [Epsilonproteobacteria bacterium]|nr:hypothetical protein [Campylobacterota bacterium]